MIIYKQYIILFDKLQTDFFINIKLLDFKNIDIILSMFSFLIKGLKPHMENQYSSSGFYYLFSI